MKPLIRWVGSKRSLVNTLLESLPRSIGDLLYVEPFVGSGALFFGMERAERCILADTNVGLISMYHAVRLLPEILIAQLSTLAATHSPETFMKVRAQYNRDVAMAGRTTDIAAAFMYLQATGFNGVYRTNKVGHYNVPQGDVSNPRICNPEEIRSASKLLANVGIVACGFEDSIPRLGDGCFVYADPPYDVELGAKGFTSYGASGFGPGKQRELAATLTSFSASGGLFLTSNADTALVRELYAGYTIRQVQGRRSVSCKGAGRGCVPELLISNYV